MTNTKRLLSLVTLSVTFAMALSLAIVFAF